MTSYEDIMTAAALRIPHAASQTVEDFRNGIAISCCVWMLCLSVACSTST